MAYLSIEEKQVEAKLSLPSVLVRGITHQNKLSLDVGICKPEGHYVYRARLVEGSIRPPYRQILLENKPTQVITPPHLDGMLAEIVKNHFGEEIDPARLATDMNFELYRRLYQRLAKG